MMLSLSVNYYNVLYEKLINHSLSPSHLPSPRIYLFIHYFPFIHTPNKHQLTDYPHNFWAFFYLDILHHHHNYFIFKIYFLFVFLFFYFVEGQNFSCVASRCWCWPCLMSLNQLAMNIHTRKHACTREIYFYFKKEVKKIKSQFSWFRKIQI